MIYYLPLGLFALLGFVELYCTRYNYSVSLLKKYLLFTAIFLMLCISGLRYKTGSDYLAYLRFFAECDKIKFGMSREPGFLLLNVLFKKIFDNFYIMQFFIMAFCTFSISGFFIKHSKYPSFSLLIYYSFFYLTLDMAQTRQHIAIAILCNSYKYITRRKLVLFFLSIVIAIQFHVTAIVTIIIYFIVKKPNKKNVFLFVSMIFFIIQFGKYIIINLLTNISNFTIIPYQLRSVFVFYLTSTRYGKSISIFSGLGILFIIFFSLIIIFMCIKYERTIYCYPFIFGFICYTLGLQFDVLMRLSNYFYICGGGFIAYNVFFSANGLYYKCLYLKPVFILLAVCYFVYNFYSHLNAKEMNVSSFEHAYLPYWSILSR
jgi:hypothetical protein